METADLGDAVVPLRRRATVVGELAVAGGVGAVEVQVCSERSTGPVTLSTGSFVVTRVGHLCGSLVFESNSSELYLHKESSM
jgi:hypothetical protein